MNLSVIWAIFKRDFINYFSSPTGYVFICVFVILSSLATFFPPAFFNNMLANLDQLSALMPLVLLVFIPAITMSSWAEERRQGTDELLLTIPATDFDVVIGKYLSAVAIFTVSLLFSMFSIWLVFSWGLGYPDMGLFFSTYLGYWFLGLAMIAMGMVASFLTRNLTVGFILGALFISPLVLLDWADRAISRSDYAQPLTRWGASSQLADFERGVISLSGVFYFLSIAAVMLYLCMVLMGRRHWGTGEDGDSRWGHYLSRAVAMLLIAGGVSYFLSNHDRIRIDATSENINSLAPGTIDMLAKLKNNKEVGNIVIDAYVSPRVPPEYASQKLNLLSTLKELQARSGGKIQTNVYEIETFSPEAETAETAFGISPQEVGVIEQGRQRFYDIFMGIAVRHKLDKVVVPFINKGIPVEYELMRSIATVADEERKRVGIVKTDAPLFESFSMQGMTPESRLVAELRKQYDVVEVNPDEPITGDFDVLLAVQPSAMGTEAMNNLVQAVKSGIPVAVFEDPMPVLWNPPVPGTAQPRQAGGPMAMFGGGQNLPKGDINQLWRLLGVRMLPDQVILQDYNPYPQFVLPPNYVVIDAEGLGTEVANPFNPDDDITSGLNQVIFINTGSLRKADNARLKVESLIVTGKMTATIDAQESIRTRDLLRSASAVNTKESFILALRVQGEIDAEEDDLKQLDLARAGEAADQEQEGQPKPAKKTPINAVVVADIDWISDDFFRIREEGERNFADVPELRFQNVTLVLNVLDSLAGDDRFIDIRKRAPHRPALTKIEEATKGARVDTRNQLDKYAKELEEQQTKAQQEFDKKLAEIEARTDLPEMERRVLQVRTMVRAQQKLDRERESAQRDNRRQVVAKERDLEQEIRGIQNRYKLFAVLLPPLPPILLGIFMYIHRRVGEREGVSKSRLRYGPDTKGPDAKGPGNKSAI